MGFLFQNVFAPYLLFFGLIALFAAGYLVKFNLIGMPRGGEEMRLLVSYSSFAFLGTLSGGVFLVQGPYFMGEYLAGPEVAGNVSAILSTAFLLTYLPPQVLQSAMMPPLFSYEYGRNEKNYVKLMAEETTSLLILIIAVVVFPPLMFPAGRSSRQRSVSTLVRPFTSVSWQWRFTSPTTRV